MRSLWSTNSRTPLCPTLSCIDKPLLILHGMDDLRTPVEGAHQLFVAVKDTHPDLPVKMVLYPHTSHDQPSHPRQRLHYYREMVSWFQKYL